MYLDIRHGRKMIFYREGVTDVRAALAEVVAKGVDLSPKNIVDSESKIYGANLPKNGDYSPESLARATLLLLRIVIKKYVRRAGHGADMTVPEEGPRSARG